eukprot:7958822-Pyramimonas_sp.AAC.1
MVCVDYLLPVRPGRPPFRRLAATDDRRQRERRLASHSLENRIVQFPPLRRQRLGLNALDVFIAVHG